MADLQQFAPEDAMAIKQAMQSPDDPISQKIIQDYQTKTGAAHYTNDGVLIPPTHAPIQMAEAKGPSQLESLGRGAAQGVTLGLQDEISPYIEKGIAKTFGSPETKSLYDSIPMDKLQNEYRAQNEDARAANPNTYGIGQLAGNLAVTAPLTAGVGSGASVAGKLFTKEGAKILGIEAVKQGVLGSILGGTNQAGLADEDKLGAAKEGAITGGLYSTLLTLGGKPLVDYGGKFIEKSLQSAQKMPTPVLEYLKQNPDKIDDIAKAAMNKNDAIAMTSEEAASKLGESFQKIVSDKNNVIDQAIAAYGDKTVDPRNVLKAFDSEIADLQKGGITPPVKSAVNALNTMKQDFLEKVGNLGQGGLTAESVNVLRKEVNKLATPAYSKAIGDNPVLADSASKIGDALRNSLDTVSPEIRVANKDLAQLIDLKKDVASIYGAKSLKSFSNEVDPADMQKIFQRMYSEGKASDLKTLDSLGELTGIDFHESGKFIQAVKSFEQKGEEFLSKFPTGKSVLAPITGILAGAGYGVATGKDPTKILELGIVGGGVGAVAQSPLGLKALMNSEKIGAGTRGLLNTIKNTAIEQKVGGKALDRNLRTP